MSKEVGSFQDNIRRTFIRFSLLPVVVMVIFAIVLFAFGWSYFMVHLNEKDNQAVANELIKAMDKYSFMLDEVAGETDGEITSDEIFSILYKDTAEFGEIGNLIVLSKDRKILF